MGTGAASWHLPIVSKAPQREQVVTARRHALIHIVVRGRITLAGALGVDGIQVGPETHLPFGIVSRICSPGRLVNFEHIAVSPPTFPGSFPVRS
jgi:hypothetical protein